MVLGQMWHANFERPSNGGYQDIYDPPQLLYHHGETDQPCDEMGFQIWPSCIKPNGNTDAYSDI